MALVCCSTECQSCSVSFKLSEANNPFMLSVIMLNVVMLSIVAPTNNLLSLGRKKWNLETIEPLRHEAGALAIKKSFITLVPDCAACQ
jgi:hypothetical protein